LIASATTLLASGRSAILDATFTKRKWRTRVIELAKEHTVEPLFIECRAPHDEVIRRLTERAKKSSQASDATVEIYSDQLKELEPLDEIPAGWHRVVDTTGDLASIVADVERKICSLVCT
jgi:predicted kinase